MFNSFYHLHGPPVGWRSRLPWRNRGFTLIELVTVVAILAGVAALLVGNLDGARAHAESTVASSSLHSVREAIVGSAVGTGYLADLTLVPGFRSVNFRLHDLFSSDSYPTAATFDPLAKRGWHGPYLTNAGQRFPAAAGRHSPDDATFQQRNFFYDASQSHYGLTNDLTINDAWGNPMVVQTPPIEAFAGSTGDTKRFRYARLLSAGADGILSTPRDRLAGMQPDGSSSQRGDDLILFLNRADIYEAEEP